MKLGRLNHVGVATPSIEKSVALYRDLRRQGYTSVAEFHYVHRLGASSALETSLALVEAAATAGLRLLLLQRQKR